MKKARSPFGPISNTQSWHSTLRWMRAGRGTSIGVIVEEAKPGGLHRPDGVNIVQLLLKVQK